MVLLHATEAATHVAINIQRNQAVDSTSREAVCASLISVIAQRVRANEIRRFDGLVALACTRHLVESDSAFRKRDIATLLESLDTDWISATLQGEEVEELKAFVKAGDDTKRHARKLGQMPEQTFRTDVISRILNGLLRDACAVAGLTWRATAALKKKRNAWTYRLRWHSRIRDAKPQAVSIITARMPISTSVEPIARGDGLLKLYVQVCMLIKNWSRHL